MPSRRTRHGYERVEDGSWVRLGDIEVEGLMKSTFRTILINTFCLLGVPYLILRWYPHYKAKLTCTRSTLQDANTVLVKNPQGEVKLIDLKSSPVRHFDYQLQRYVWNHTESTFNPLEGSSGTLVELLETSKGLTDEQREFKLDLYGSNKICIEIKSYFTLFMDEVLNPFYIFELLSVILWSFDEYYYYAFCVLILSLTSIATSLYQTRKQLMMLRDMVAIADNTYVTVLDENGDPQPLNSTELVPGDILLIPSNGCLLTCDALLMTGTCIVNESTLTGESTPVTKIPAVHEDEEYQPTSTHARHTLYCGTQIIQTRFYHHDNVTAMVVRTGTMTAKGQLIRSILYPKNIGFDFYRDAIRFVIILFVIAVFGCAYSVYIFITRQASLETILLRSLDIITIVVPPALPAAMTVGTVYSQNRLKKKGIYCIAPSRINIAGKIKLVCFDKTGTLTEEGLSVWGVLKSDGRRLLDLPNDPATLSLNSPLLHAMATCHSLTKIEGSLCGDPLDLSMFQATSWALEEPGNETNRFDMLAPTVVRPPGRHFISVPDLEKMDGTDIQVPYEIGIVRQFPFSSNAQSMSVITRTLGANAMILFTKGAPEKIRTLCLPETVPMNLFPTLSYYTSSGFRVIAIAYKELPKKFRWTHAQRATRNKVEADLTFLGLLLMQNTLKPQSSPVIRQLQHARIKCLMLTGDNMLTAVSVSRECGLIAHGMPLSQVVISSELPHTIQLQSLNSSVGHTEVDATSALALDGETWRQLGELLPSLVPQVATRAVVFARMSPQQKAQVVETLQSLDYVVAMIGDGANDCGALRAAHVGVSLSGAEASIAAPFTAVTPDITCLPTLITEGRCALVTSFGLFNFMALYSLAQFSSALFLYVRGVEMGNMEFLYVDLVITTSLALAMGRAGPANKLVQTRPLTALASPSNVVPVIMQIILTVLIQFASLEVLKYQPWYVPVNVSIDDETVVTCWENTTVFLISTFQYLILAAMCSKGKPHRQPFIENWMMVMVLSTLCGFNIVLLLAPWHDLIYFFELEPISDDDVKFRTIILVLPTINLIISIIIEKTVANSFWLKWCLHKIQRKKHYKNKYKIVETQILSSRFWDSKS